MVGIFVGMIWNGSVWLARGLTPWFSRMIKILSSDSIHLYTTMVVVGCVLQLSGYYKDLYILVLLNQPVSTN